MGNQSWPLRVDLLRAGRAAHQGPSGPRRGQALGEGRRPSPRGRRPRRCRGALLAKKKQKSKNAEERQNRADRLPGCGTQMTYGHFIDGHIKDNPTCYAAHVAAQTKIADQKQGPLLRRPDEASECESRWRIPCAGLRPSRERGASEIPGSQPSLL